MELKRFRGISLYPKKEKGFKGLTERQTESGRGGDRVEGQSGTASCAGSMRYWIGCGGRYQRPARPPGSQRTAARGSRKGQEAPTVPQARQEIIGRGKPTGSSPMPCCRLKRYSRRGRQGAGRGRPGIFAARQ